MEVLLLIICGFLLALFAAYKVWSHFFMKKLLTDKKGDDYYLNEHDTWHD